MTNSPFNRTLIEPGIVKTDVDGRVDAACSDRAIDELLDYATDDEIYELVEYNANAEIAISYEQTNRILDKIYDTFGRLNKACIAYVANDNDLIYGMGRQLQARIDHEHVYINVFRNEQEALSWLRGMQKIPSPGRNRNPSART